MQTISMDKLSGFIYEVAFVMRYVPMIWGMPGAGKSELTGQLAEEHDAHLVDIRLSQYDSVDLRGFPTVNENGLTVWNMPSTMPFKGNPNFSDDGIIVLFLDELNSAAPAVLAVAYQLINDRGVGEHKLMDNVVIVAAGNREGDRGVTSKMPTPLANRFIHIEAVPTAEASAVYFQKVLPKGVAGLAAAFLMFRKDLIVTFDPTKPDKAYATPRSWEKAFRIYARAAAGDMGWDVAQAAMAGSVGDGPAHEFIGFTRVWQSITPIEKILKDPEGVPLPDEMSAKYATTMSVSGHMDHETVDVLQQYLDRLEPEMGVLAWNMAVKRDESLFTADAFTRYAKRTKAAFT